MTIKTDASLQSKIKSDDNPKKRNLTTDEELKELAKSAHRHDNLKEQLAIRSGSMQLQYATKEGNKKRLNKFGIKRKLREAKKLKEVKDAK